MTVGFLISLTLVGLSSLFKLQRAATLEQLLDWRQETTTTWRGTLEQMNRIEARQSKILRELRILQTTRPPEPGTTKTGGE